MLSKLNGWQRIWIVLSALWIPGFGLLVPFLEVNRIHYNSYYFEQKWGIERDIAGGACEAYLVRPIHELPAPEFSAKGGNCYNIYTARKYNPTDRPPFTMEKYLERRKEERRSDLFLAILVCTAIAIATSGLVYSIGLIISWIRKGFALKQE